jgi:hypothetical protein
VCELGGKENGRKKEQSLRMCEKQMGFGYVVVVVVLGMW